MKSYFYTQNICYLQYNRDKSPSERQKTKRSNLKYLILNVAIQKNFLASIFVSIMRLLSKSFWISKVLDLVPVYLFTDFRALVVENRGRSKLFLVEFRVEKVVCELDE